MTTAALPGPTGDISLGGTPSYKARSCRWTPAGPGDQHDGRLTVTVTRGRRTEADVYAVEELPLVGAGGRAFLLLNVTDDGQPDVYETFVVADGHRWKCTCDAGRAGRHRCKHADALAAVLAHRAADDDLPECFKGLPPSGRERAGVPF